MSRFAVFRGPGNVDVVDQPTLDVGLRDALIDVEGCGICGSDLTSYRDGAYISPGQVMGHEFVGTVAEAGAGANVAVGDRLVVRPMRSCGNCSYCRRGDIHLCSHTAELSLSFGLPGGYAERVFLPAPEPGVDVFRVPREVEVRDAIWTEPLAVALHALARAGDVTGRRVLIVGCGSVGLCLLTAARLAGATTYVVEPRETRRVLAAKLGADHVFADSTEIAPWSVDCVLDSSGVPEALTAASAVTVPGAVLVLVGVTKRDVEPPVGRRVVGSFGYQEADFSAAAELITNRRARLGDAVTHVFDLQSFEEAMHVASSDPNAGKVVIAP